MYLNRNKACQILNLDPSVPFSDDDVKKAYRKKAFQVHPDKSPQNPPNDDFIQVKMARDFLLNDDINEIPSFNLYAEFIEKAIKGIKRFMKEKFEEMKTEDDDKKNDNYKTIDIHLKIDITLHELYCDKGKKITYRYLDESGELLLRSIYISCINYEIQRRFIGFGDWDSNTKTYGDLTINMHIDCPKHYVINSCIDKLDLIRSIPISLYDYYYGFKTEINHFNETIKIEHNPHYHGRDIIVEQKGLQGEKSRGDLYLLFEIDFTWCNEDVMCEDSMKKTFPSLYP